MIDFTNIGTKTLVATHNACVALLGGTPVKKFADRATAEKRTAFVLSQVTPAKRPAPFTEEEPLPGGARQLDAMKGSVRAKDAPHPAIKSITSVSGPALERRNVGHDLKTADTTPTPPVSEKTPRWRKPKKVAPAKVAYRPRAGSLQHRMYQMLTRESEHGFGCTVEEFCEDQRQAGAAPTMLKLEQTWSNLGYLFVSQKGYGLEFDGERIWLLVPADERDAVPAKKGG